jgi:hypothetical protein
MNTKRKKKIRPDCSTESSRTGVLMFAAAGEMRLGADWVPVELEILSLEGPMPVSVELKASRGRGELALRMGCPKGKVELNVRGRQFCARRVGRLKNSPIHMINASDVFSALFPPVFFVSERKSNHVRVGTR